MSEGTQKLIQLADVEFISPRDIYAFIMADMEWFTEGLETKELEKLYKTLESEIE